MLRSFPEPYVEPRRSLKYEIFDSPCTEDCSEDSSGARRCLLTIFAFRLRLSPKHSQNASMAMSPNYFNAADYRNAETRYCL